MGIKKDWKVFKNADWALADINLSFRQKKVTLNYHIVVDNVIVGEQEIIVRVDSLKPEIILDNYLALEEAYLDENEPTINSEIDSIYNGYVKDKVLTEKEKTDKKAEISDGVYKKTKILYYQSTKQAIYGNIADEFLATKAIKDLNKMVYKQLRSE